MSRPPCCRRVAALPASPVFKPAGIPARDLAEVVLTVDEFEALRLADYEGLYQEQAAERMTVSRQTFGRIVESARKKVAQALVNGMILRIEGGQVTMVETRAFECIDCGHVWEVPYGTGRPEGCPACESKRFRRAQTEPSGAAGVGGRGRCRRQRNRGQTGQGRGRGSGGGRATN